MIDKTQIEHNASAFGCIATNRRWPAPVELTDEP